eukprot:CAMPEP_0184858874 /NCGR_PEP_ID=MMETSP0580-20130426/3905_1 /TAXON_ID=1118495 /ORGANISM="Dactyliosolen fragilissimus" /LENGTH=159 /DNA_ID=CAMNT_0027355211 /DNA_START=87 /DNA_END=566 /DNA_ORIENTATION=-
MVLLAETPSSSSSTAIVPHLMEKGKDSTITNQTMIVLDSLPYIDAINLDYEVYALSLIEEEMKSIMDDNNYISNALQHLPNPLKCANDFDEGEKIPSFAAKTDKNIVAMNREGYASLLEQNGQPRSSDSSSTLLSIYSKPLEADEDKEMSKEMWEEAIQ